MEDPGVGGRQYTMWASAQGPLGGVTQLPEQAKQIGAWPYWQGNAQVANLDAAIAKVKELVWGHGDTQLGGMMTMPPGMKGPTGQAIPPNWMYYVTVADLDATLARATAKGARVLNGPMGVPGGQRIVQLLDPQGAAFALITPPQT